VKIRNDASIRRVFEKIYKSFPVPPVETPDQKMEVLSPFRFPYLVSTLRTKVAPFNT
jgi:hypothetical protein